MSKSTAVIPTPGTDLVPDGWWEEVVVPWADLQSDGSQLRDAAAQLAGLESAYRTLGADALELTKARRYIELRWGELLGDVSPGQRTDQEPSHASEGSLGRMDRHRFRQLAGARTQVLARLREAGDAEEITRAALLRLSKPKPASSDDVAAALRGLVGAPGRDPAPAAREPHAKASIGYSVQQARKRQRAVEHLQASLQRIDAASAEGLSAFAMTQLLREAAIAARHAAVGLEDLAFTFER